MAQDMDQLKFYVTLEVPSEKFEYYHTMENIICEGVEMIAQKFNGSIVDIEIK